MSARSLLAAAAMSEALTPVFISSSSTYVNAASTTLTAPANIQNGDLLVLLAAVSDDALTITPPAGFNTWSYSSGSANPTVCISTKVANNESGNYTVSWGSSRRTVLSMLVFRNATGVNTVSDVVRGSTPSAPSITPTFKGVRLVAFMATANTTVSSPPSGMDELVFAPYSDWSIGIFGATQEVEASSSVSWPLAGSGPNSVAIHFQVTNENIITPAFIGATFGEATNGVLSIPKPAGLQDGDLVLRFAFGGGANPNWTPTVAFTTLVDSSDEPYIHIDYRSGLAGDPASYMLINSNTTSVSGAILAYRNATIGEVSSVLVTGLNGVHSGILSNASQAILIGAMACKAASVGTFNLFGLDNRYLDSNASAPSFRLFDVNRTPNGPTGDRKATSLNSFTRTVLLTINPTGTM